MRIANFETADGLRQGIGVETKDGLLDFTRTLVAFQVVIGELPDEVESIQEMVEEGVFERGLFERVMEFVEESNLWVQLAVEEGYKLLAPIPRPRAIYAFGRTYPAHAIEHVGKAQREPVVFAKAATSVIGPEEPVIYKKFLTRVDPEAELAVIIGRTGANISEEDAAEYIAGYTILNDVTARDLQAKDIEAREPWFRAKGIDTFCPMGPWVVFPEDVGDPVELEVEMRVNGELRQKDNTRSMSCSLPYLISWLSQYFTLEPGNVVATGTPEGMKPVVPGDIMEVSVEKIGVLRNPVVAE